MASPAVTVCMPVYNGAAFLREAVGSVLTQTFSDFELLVIDDGSTDASAEILASLQEHDKRIRVLKNGKNEGLVFTRNLAVREARGRFLALLDCDDTASPERLSQQVGYLTAHADCGLVGSQAVIIDQHGRPHGRGWTAKVDPGAVSAVLLFNNCIAQSTVMARREIFERIPYRSAFPLAEDYDVWVRVSREESIWILPKPLVRYRIHPASISKQKEQQLRESVRRIFSYQLAELGIFPSENELNIHETVSSELPPRSRECVEACERWLLKIKQANDRVGLFPDHSLLRVIARKWLLICGNAGLGRWGVETYYRSPLSSLAPASSIDRLKLALKSYTGIKRKWLFERASLQARQG